MLSLSIKIISAGDLPNIGVVGKPDPYCLLKIAPGGRQFKTKHASSTINPEWNESCELTLNDPNSEQLVVEVWDSNVTSDTAMGSYTFGLQSLNEGPNEMK
eukprot:gene23117-9461_t